MDFSIMDPSLLGIISELENIDVQHTHHYVLVVSTKIENKEEKDHGHDHDQRPNAVERAIGLTDNMRIMDRIKSWVRLAGINIFQEPVRAQAGPAEMIREAASVSFEKSKETAEKSAKAAGAAVHNTVEKVKRKVSNSGELKDHDL
ncbi:hypothetical protein Syun_018334 [Stephania yunnanensis]|uniref:Uncharacterized protein n=1 Tax=Stephania yunnanensis TaxID=152371 RepID=A0AAP0IS16_9MAGN